MNISEDDWCKCKRRHTEVTQLQHVHGFVHLHHEAVYRSRIKGDREHKFKFVALTNDGTYVKVKKKKRA